ncbi:hypothetical protein OF83DRAFT_443501 [Amylostereum chailletii]|nr:hypothetical protein OF83DRAFT_443501 [Amylostereum chailletii]
MDPTALETRSVVDVEKSAGARDEGQCSTLSTCPPRTRSRLGIVVAFGHIGPDLPAVRPSPPPFLPLPLLPSLPLLSPLTTSLLLTGHPRHAAPTPRPAPHLHLHLHPPPPHRAALPAPPPLRAHDRASVGPGVRGRRGVRRGGVARVARVARVGAVRGARAERVDVEGVACADLPLLVVGVGGLFGHPQSPLRVARFLFWGCSGRRGGLGRVHVIVYCIVTL